MPQKTSTQGQTAPSQSVLEISDAPSTDAADASTASLPELTESYANSLIDEVFEEVDRMLENGVAVVDGAKAEQRHATSPNDAGETRLIPHDHASLQPDGAAELADMESSLTDGAAASADTSQTPPPNDSSGPVNILTSFLPILVACASLGIALSAGLVLHHQQRQLADTPAVPDETTPSADAEFLAYMNQALEVISQKEEAEQSGAIQRTRGQANAAESSTDPDLAAAGQDSSPDAGNPPTLVDPIPMPVYQPPRSIASLPTVPIQEPLAPPAQTPPAPSASTPSDFPAAPSAPASADPAPPLNIAPASTHTLVGLLQLGDRSAAIFEFDGNAQRIAVGERIGSSGWSLVSVSNDEAIIRRNGEVRSIYIGQSF